MVVVKLYGVLESVAQRTTKLRVDNFDDALRAIFANFPKLRRLIRDMRIAIMVDGKPLTFEDCLKPFHTERIDIMPIVGGTGPAIGIVIGAMMSYGASAVASELFLSGVVSMAMSAAIQTFMFNMGVSLILGGISQMLFKPPTGDTSAKEDTPSYTFNGAVNTTTQGNIVPVGFGRMIVGSVVIAVNIQTFDIPVNISVETAESLKPPPEISQDVPSSMDWNVA